QTFGSGISYLLAVATIFTDSGNLYCQWELLTWQWECLVHFIPNRSPKDTRRNIPVETQRRNVPVETSTSNALVSQCIESVDARILVYQQNETIFEEDIKLLKLNVQLRDNALVDLRKKFKKAEQERDDFESDVSMPDSLVYDRYKLGEGYHAVPPPYTGTFMPPKPDLVFHDASTMNEIVPIAFNVELSPTKPDTDLSKSNRPSAPLIEDWVTDSEDDYEGEPMATQKAPSFVQTVKHIKTPRPSVKLVEHPIPAANLKTDILKSKGHRNSRNRKACFVSVLTAVLTKSQLVPLTAARPVTTVVPHNNLIRLRPAKTVGTKPHSPPRRTINHRPSPPASNFPPKVTTVKAHKVNAVKGVQRNWGGNITGKGKIRTGKLDFDDVYFVKELKFNLFSVSQMCDKKNVVLFTDTECIVLSPDFKLPDENQVLLGNRVLVTKPHNKTPYELLLGITPSIGFMRPFGCPVTILNTLDPLGKFDRKADEGFLVGYSVSSNQPNPSTGVQEHFDADKVGEGNVQQYVLFPLWSSGSKDPQNTNDDATFEVKKPEFEVHVSPSSSTKTKKHDDKTKREAKGKSPVELSTLFRNNEEFEDFSDDSINEVNAASTTVPTVGQISTNRTNTFSAAGPSNTAVSPTHGKSSYVDTSQYPDDPNMLALEDITYSDNKEDVGAEADFSNLETNITVSSILTTRVHKDHPVIQIIGDLSSATQTRSMIRMFKDQGGLTQINNEDFHTYMFTCFLSQEEPKRVHQELKDPSWIEAMQEELLQFKMEKVWVLVDLPKDPRAWYETLANYLLENGFQREKVDQTLFIKKQKGDILLVQVYVDDIIFCSTNKDLLKQKLDGIFISQDKYVAEILRKFRLVVGKSASTPIDTKKPLLKDPDGEDVDLHTYRSMIGSLMYQTSSRPDIMFAIFGCVRF
nr:hypothetical protein [Tanacetum cinerariifolium]